MTKPTATEHAARTAWVAGLRSENPMPVGVMLDHVQDETGDRDDAVLELWDAGAKWLEAMIPDSGEWMNCLSLHEYAFLTSRDLAGGGFHGADHWLQGVRTIAADLRIAWGDGLRLMREEYEIAGRFLDWAKLAQSAMDLCKQIEDTA